MWIGRERSDQPAFVKTEDGQLEDRPKYGHIAGNPPHPNMRKSEKATGETPRLVEEEENYRKMLIDETNAQLSWRNKKH